MAQLRHVAGRTQRKKDLEARNISSGGKLKRRIKRSGSTSDGGDRALWEGSEALVVSNMIKDPDQRSCKDTGTGVTLELYAKCWGSGAAKM